MAKKDEIVVTFSIDKDLLKAFAKAQENKEREMGIRLSKKQAFHLALIDATENWK